MPRHAQLILAGTVESVLRVLGPNELNQRLVDEIRPFPLWDMACVGDWNEPRFPDSAVECITYGDWKYSVMFSPDYQRRLREGADTRGKV